MWSLLVMVLLSTSVAAAHITMSDEEQYREIYDAQTYGYEKFFNEEMRNTEFEFKVRPDGHTFIATFTNATHYIKQKEEPRVETEEEARLRQMRARLRTEDSLSPEEVLELGLISAGQYRQIEANKREEEAPFTLNSTVVAEVSDTPGGVEPLLLVVEEGRRQKKVVVGGEKNAEASGATSTVTVADERDAVAVVVDSVDSFKEKKSLSVSSEPKNGQNKGKSFFARMISFLFK
jgi:hypothetical protein